MSAAFTQSRMTQFGPRHLNFTAMHKVNFHLASAKQFHMFGARAAWVELLSEAVLESGVVFGFGLLWSGHADVAIQNTR